MTAPAAHQPLERLVQIIAPQGRLLRAWNLKGGISAEMTALEIALPDGSLRKIIARRPGAGAHAQKARAVEDEYRLLRLTRSAGLPTQTPYYLDREGEIFSTPCLAIEYIDGEPLFALADMDGFLRQFAAQLAAIHRLDVTGPDFAFLPPGAKQADALLARRPASLDDSLEEGRIRGVLEAAWPIPTLNAPALLHGDYWPGNVLWQGGRLAAVIDWEDAALGDPLIDLAITRLDLAWIFGPQAMTGFTQYYLDTAALDTTSLPYWDLYAALRLIRLAGPDLAGWAAFFHPYGRTDITEQSIRGHYEYFIEMAYHKRLTAKDAKKRKGGKETPSFV